MLNKKTRKAMSIFLVSTILFAFPIKGQASVSSDIYSQGISVGFASMGTINKLDFVVTDDYFIQNENVMLKKDQNYRLELSGSIFKLYQNNLLILTTSNNVILKPTLLGSFIQFDKNGIKGNFPGSMTFRKNGDYFVPINTLRIEDYIKGVVPFEMSNSRPIEALKAQAVAARTYTIANKGSYAVYGYDLRDDVYSQVYKGYMPNYSSSNRAVEETRGRVLTYGGRAISALYSASNGGYTEKSINVWSGSNPYFVDEPDPYDTVYKNWTRILNQNDIDGILKTQYPDLKVKNFIKIDIENIKKFVSGRIQELPIKYLDESNIEKALIIGKDRARTFFGLNSAMYNVTVSRDITDQYDIYTFVGNGWGHGIGMSQWGAYTRAEQGQSYLDILNFYYRNTLLENASLDEKITSFNKRIGGIDRYATSRLIAENVNNEQVNSVILATGNDFPDALSGAVLAKQVGGPILLVDKKPGMAGSKEALNYISNHLSRSGSVYILGGDGVVSNEYITVLKQMGINESNIIRLGGLDRQQTALKIANQLNANNSPVVIVTEADFPDALSISSIAALRGWPILLTSKDKLSKDMESYITLNKPEKVYIVGSTGVVSDIVKNRVNQLLGATDDSRVIRIGGKDRYETSRLISSSFIPYTEEAVLATGIDYPDALSGSVYAAMNGAPILLVSNGYTSDAEKYLRVVNYDGSYTKLTVMGASGAVSDNIVNYLSGLK